MEQHSLPGARFVDPKVLARIGNLELLAKTVVDGFINGLHRSPYFGASVDFAEHRGYMPGDDIRRVDWKLYARTDRYYLKEYEADTNANFSIILDISRSMDFSSRGISKLEYGKYLVRVSRVLRAAAARPHRLRDLRQRHRHAHSAVGEAPRPRAAHARSRQVRTEGRSQGADAEDGGAFRPPRHSRHRLGLVRVARGHHGCGQAAAVPRQRSRSCFTCSIHRRSISTSPKPRASRISRPGNRFPSCRRRSPRSTSRSCRSTSPR